MKNFTAKSGTIARTIVLALALINQLLSVTGHTVIDVGNDDINQLVSVGCTIAASVVAWWKNNSFTGAAIRADEQMNREKGKSK